MFLKFNLIKKIITKEQGITLVEIIVVTFIVVLFSSILILNFPKIQRQFALSRVAYKMAQDLRRVQDLGMSGVTIEDDFGQEVSAKGYGLYVDSGFSPSTGYILYADDDTLYDSEYTAGVDYIIESVDISKENSDLYIKEITNIIGNNTSVNFSPPDPVITIDNYCQICSQEHGIGIVIGLLGDNSSRTVWVNKSGLIEIR